MNNDWISIKDSFPEVKEGYLLAVAVINMNDDDPYPFIVHYDGNKERGFELLEVTHWYPLPRPPK